MICLRLLFFPIRFLVYLLYKFSNLFSKQKILHHFVPNEFSNQPNRGMLNLLFSSKEIPFIEYIHFLEILTKEKIIQEVILDIPDMQAPWHQVEEIGKLLKKIRASGKKIFAYCNHGNLKSIFLLACADRRFADPNANFVVLFPAHDSYFIKEALSLLGIEVETQHVGKYKSGGFEMFTRTNFSEEHKKSMTHLISSMRKIIQDSLEETPHLSKNKIQALQKLLFEQSLVQAQDLFEINFFEKLFEVEHLLHYSIHKKIKSKKVNSTNIYTSNYKNNKKGKIKNELIEEEKINGKICDQATVLSRYKKNNFPLLRFKTPASLAFVTMEGSIQMGSKNIPHSPKKILAIPYCDLFEKLASGPEEMIILYINSPGGSADASENLYQKIQTLSQSKPVIAILGSVAASGGYYIACAANRIYASSLSLTGSIGVIRIRPEVSKLYQKIGVRKLSLFQDPTRDVFSEVAKLKKPTLKMLDKQLKSTYKLFLERVAEGRKLNIKDVEKMAQGRVFTGKEFQETKMIDGICNVNDAILLYKQEYKKLTGKNTLKDFHINYYPNPKPSFSTLLSNLSIRSFQNMALNHVYNRLDDINELIELHSNKPLFYCKESIDIKHL